MASQQTQKTVNLLVILKRLTSDKKDNSMYTIFEVDNVG